MCVFYVSLQKKSMLKTCSTCLPASEQASCKQASDHLLYVAEWDHLNVRGESTVYPRVENFNADVGTQGCLSINETHLEI